MLAENGLRQLHVAETEKYAHVTYFFNGGREDEWPGEKRVLFRPPGRPELRPQPEMSALEVTDRFVEALGAHDPAFAVLNFANPDMVGHTGSIPAAIKAVETVDACLGRVVEAVESRGGVCLVTADHGNAEQMPSRTSPTRRTRRTSSRCADRHKCCNFDGERRLGSCGPRAPRADKPLQMTGKT